MVRGGSAEVLNQHEVAAAVHVSRVENLSPVRRDGSPPTGRVVKVVLDRSNDSVSPSGPFQRGEPGRQSSDRDRGQRQR